MEKSNKFTAFEKEILERAFYAIDDYSAWDDLVEDEDEPMDFENDIKPQIEELKKKIGIE
jgi:hypothetical protein